MTRIEAATRAQLEAIRTGKIHYIGSVDGTRFEISSFPQRAWATIVLFNPVTVKGDKQQGTQAIKHAHRF